MSRYIDIETLNEFIHNLKIVVNSPNSDYWEGYACALSAVERLIAQQPTADVVEIPEGGIGNLSDGYHTFNELYHHRAILFSAICNSMPDKAWKSKLHDTGDMFDGMFIVGIETPEGQATYHYDIKPYWNMFKVKELEKAPKWDGHTPQDAIDRISKISADVVEVRHGYWKYRFFDSICSECGWLNKAELITRSRTDYPICPNCSAKMDGERNKNGT